MNRAKPRKCRLRCGPRRGGDRDVVNHIRPKPREIRRKPFDEDSLAGELRPEIFIDVENARHDSPRRPACLLVSGKGQRRIADRGRQRCQQNLEPRFQAQFGQRDGMGKRCHQPVISL